MCLLKVTESVKKDLKKKKNLAAAPAKGEGEEFDPQILPTNKKFAIFFFLGRRLFYFFIYKQFYLQEIEILINRLAEITIITYFY